jgi:hypothetical protein
MLCFSAQGQRSLIMNGSFEQNGQVIPDITLESPVFWCDVNIANGKFKGKVNTDWASHPENGAGYSLQLLTDTFADLIEGDRAYVSQKAFFETDINSLSFDLWLTTNPGSADWDVNEITALILIDGVEIWNSDSLTYDEQGEFLGTIVIESDSFIQFLDHSEYTLTLALESDVTDAFITRYIAVWDFVKFDKYCGGLGFLDGDLNQDCFVNFVDLAVLGLSWMNEPASLKDDLYEDGIVDEYDLELFAEDWLYNTDWTKWGQDGTFQMERLELDLDLSGEIDLGDVMVLSEYWLSDGRCAGIELSGNDVVNFEDFAALVNQWGLRDWLYYVQD